MGSYTGDRDGSSTDDSSDEQPDEGDPNQPGLDDFDKSEDELVDGDDNSESVPSGAGGGVGPVPVPEESPVSEPEEEESEGDEESTEPGAEETDDLQEREPEEEQESENEQESEDEDEEDEEEETVTVTVTADPLSAMSWGIQPVITRVKENYGDQVEFRYNVAPVRSFEDQAEMREQWEASTDVHGMPVDLDFWDDPPESTELINRALIAAMRQGAGEPYLQALWREGIAGGQNLNDEVALDSLASRMQLDVGKFQEDMEDADLETDPELDELPVTQVLINGHTQSRTGNVHYTDFKEQFIFEGLDEGEPQDLVGFVGEHEPVATAEVMEVYQWDREEAGSELQGADGIYSMNICEGSFWFKE